MKTTCFMAFVLSAASADAQAPRFPNALQTYLGLTDQQASTIAGLNADYQRFNAGKQSRISQIQSDLAAATAAEQIDAVSLGMGYAEIEAIRRDLRDKLTDLRGNTVKVLTASQQPKVRALADARALQPLASDARCAYLLPSPVITIPAATVSQSGSSTAVFLLGIPSATACFTFVPLGGSEIAPLSPSLAAYLSPTTAQTASMRQLQAAYSDFAAQKQERIAQVRREIATLTNADQLDPLAIGNAYAEIEAIQRDLRDKQAGLTSDLQKLLTEPQKAKVKTVADAESLQGVISQAECENLLAPQPERWFDTTGFVPGSVRDPFPSACGI